MVLTVFTCVFYVVVYILKVCLCLCMFCLFVVFIVVLFLIWLVFVCLSLFCFVFIAGMFWHDSMVLLRLFQVFLMLCLRCFDNKTATNKSENNKNTKRVSCLWSVLAVLFGASSFRARCFLACFVFLLWFMCVCITAKLWVLF